MGIKYIRDWDQTAIDVKVEIFDVIIIQSIHFWENYKLIIIIIDGLLYLVLPMQSLFFVVQYGTTVINSAFNFLLEIKIDWGFSN